MVYRNFSVAQAIFFKAPLGDFEYHFHIYALTITGWDRQLVLLQTHWNVYSLSHTIHYVITGITELKFYSVQELCQNQSDVGSNRPILAQFWCIVTCLQENAWLTWWACSWVSVPTRSMLRNYGGVEGPPHIFFRHHAISYGWHSNSSVGDSNYCYVIRRTY